MDFVTDHVDAAAWDAAVDAYQGGMQQSWRYGEITARAPGRAVLRVAARDQGRTIAIAQILIRCIAARMRVGLISRGPLFQPTLGPAERRKVVRGLRRVLAEHGPGVLITTPETGALPGFLPVSAPVSLAVLDLRPEVAILRAGLRGKWRNRLVRAEAADLWVGTSRQIDWLLAREAENRHQFGYRGLPPDFLLGWSDALEAWRIYVARFQGKIVAAALFLLHGTGASYQIGWSGPQGRRLNAQNLVMWRAIEGLCKTGTDRLDLGRADRDRAPGLARFKFGTGAAQQVLGTTGVALPSFGFLH